MIFSITVIAGGLVCLNAEQDGIRTGIHSSLVQAPHLRTGMKLVNMPT